MLYANTEKVYGREIIIRSIGMEDIPSQAHWGPGVRESYVLHYVLEGKGYFNGIPVSQGQGFFIDGKELHEYHFDSENPWTYFWVSFRCTRSFLEECLKNTGFSMEHCVFDVTFFSELKDLIQSLNLKNQCTLTASKALSVFYSLIALHENQAAYCRLDPSENTYVQDAIFYMENNYHLPIKITDIASYIHVDDRYLYNLFKEKRGISPKTYLNTLRIDRSCYLLKNTSLSVTSVGQSVGYSDSLAFSTFFKKHTGLSPKQYRQKNGRVTFQSP